MRPPKWRRWLQIGAGFRSSDRLWLNNHKIRFTRIYMADITLGDTLIAFSLIHLEK
jgi:hypothetical protein